MSSTAGDDLAIHTAAALSAAVEGKLADVKVRLEGAARIQGALEPDLVTKVLFAAAGAGHYEIVSWAADRTVFDSWARAGEQLRLAAEVAEKAGFAEVGLFLAARAGRVALAQVAPRVLRNSCSCFCAVCSTAALP